MPEPSDRALRRKYHTDTAGSVVALTTVGLLLLLDDHRFVTSTAWQALLSNRISIGWAILVCAVGVAVTSLIQRAQWIPLIVGSLICCTIAARLGWSAFVEPRGGTPSFVMWALVAAFLMSGTFSHLKWAQ